VPLAWYSMWGGVLLAGLFSAGFAFWLYRRQRQKETLRVRGRAGF